VLASWRKINFVQFSLPRRGTWLDKPK